MRRAQARVTLPALRQEGQTLRRLGVLSTFASPVWIFGFQRLGVRRWEWETDMPKPGPLPQTSQTLATMASLDVPMRNARDPGTPRSLTGARAGFQTRRPRPTRRTVSSVVPSILRADEVGGNVLAE